MKFFKISLYFICLMMIFSLSQANAQFFFFQDPMVGQHAPDFKLKNLQGNDISFNENRGKSNAIIFFWATWCPHCQRAIQVVSSLSEQISKDGIKLYVIDVGESKAEIMQAIKRLDVDLDLLLDQDGRVSEQYGLLGIPSFFFIDSEGKVIVVKHEFPSDYQKIFLKK